MMKKSIFIVAFFLQMLPICAQSIIEYRGLRLITGDLLFVGAQDKNLSAAINRVTQKNEQAQFDHVGIIEVADGIPYLLHATGKKGSVREMLDSVIATHTNDRFYTVYRLDSTYMNTIPEAIEQAKKLLGKPYNWTYVLNDSSYYCSDYIERIFRHINIFQLEPMTFIDPSTGKTDEYWSSFYKKQGMIVPEGQLGCNPNGLASNSSLHRIGILAPY